MVWLPRRWPAATIWRMRSGCWRAWMPMGKKVARTLWRARTSRRCGVTAALVSRYALLKFVEDAVGADGLPVGGGDVPHHRRQAEFAGSLKDVRATGSEGWAEEFDGCAGDVFEDGVAAGEFLANPGGGLPG